MAVRQVRDSSARLVVQMLNSVRDRVLGVVLEHLDQHQATLDRHGRIIRQLEARMGAVGDAIRQFRSQVDAETTRLGGVLADQQAKLDELQGRLSAGEAAAVAEISGELTSMVDTLRALGTGDPADPVPAPDEPVDRVGDLCGPSVVADR